jgi:hypothetical protein
MRDRFEKHFILSTLRKINYERTSLSLSNTQKIQCLLREMCTNFCKRKRKFVYKHEEIWTCEGRIGKLVAY